MTLTEAMNKVLDEIKRAEQKHPRWPDDRLRQVVIIGEEAGEALKEALSIIEDEESLMLTPLKGYEITLAYNRLARREEELEKEVIQTAAMAIRWLINRKPLYAQS